MSGGDPLSAGEASVLMRIESTFGELPSSEQRVAELVRVRPERVVALAIHHLAAEAGTSEATVVRLCQRLGYEGYREFRIRVAQELRAAAPTPAASDEDSPLGHLVTQTGAEAVKAVEATVAGLNLGVLDAAASVLADARRVDFYGAGSSAIVAFDAHIKFLRLDVVGTAYMNAHLQVMSAALAGPEDAAVAISHSGCTRDTVHSLARARSGGAHTIAITSFADMPIETHADLVLYTHSDEDLSRGAFGARLAQLTLVDILFLAVAQKRGLAARVTMNKAREALIGKIFGENP